jgi:hypothetical protein
MHVETSIELVSVCLTDVFLIQNKNKPMHALINQDGFLSSRLSMRCSFINHKKTKNQLDNVLIFSSERVQACLDIAHVFLAVLAEMLQRRATCVITCCSTKVRETKK